MLKDKPIQTKLMTVTLLTSAVVLVLTCAAFFVYEYYSFRKTTVYQLSVISKMIASNSTAALAFKNVEDAHEILSALQAEAHIRAGALYAEDGKLFAKYTAFDSLVNVPATLPSGQGFEFANNMAIAIQPVVHDGMKMGTLYLVSDLDAIYERFTLYGAIVIAVIIISFFTAYSMSRVLQRRLSKPILDLANTAKSISENTDYSVRAKKYENDEVGFLTEAFNKMLVTIETQNQEILRQNHEQAQAVLKIKEREERFRILANSIPQFVWIADEKGQVQYMSDQWERYSGISTEEGKKLFSSLIHEEDVGEVRAKWAEAFRNLTAWTSEFRLKNTKTGEYRWFSGQTVPVKNESGNLVTWIGSASDIHRQKTINFELEGLVAERTSELVKLNNVLVQKNEELAKAQTFLQTVLDSSVELVTALDTQLNYTYVNKRLTAISDRKPEQLIGRNVLEVNPGFEKTDGYQHLMKALKGEIVHFEARSPYINSDVVFETFVIPLRHHGEVTGVVTMQRDITALVSLTENLKASNEQLVRSNEDLQQFAHVTSHDLKEPVRKIKMYGNILSTDFATYLPDKGKEYLARIEKATTRITAMIDGVLQYAIVDVSDQFVHEIDLNTVVKSIIEDLEIPIKDYKANIEYSDLPALKGYPTLVNQLLYNLINNSLKFRKPGIAPRIKIYTQQLDETESKELQGNFFKVVLEDNGVGFDQSYAEKIFESFTRLHPKDQFEGTGLGLALCRKIVLRHKGIIKASGELNKGAKFSIFFPKAILIPKTVAP